MFQLVSCVERSASFYSHMQQLVCVLKKNLFDEILRGVISWFCKMTLNAAGQYFKHRSKGFFLEMTSLVSFLEMPVIQIVFFEIIVSYGLFASP